MGLISALSSARRALPWHLLLSSASSSKRRLVQSVMQGGHRTMATVAAHLTSRGVIEVSGEDSSTFLQGITTNDMFALKESDVIYTSFLSVQGRIQHDAFVYHRLSNGTETLLLDVDDSSKEDLMQQILKYKLRAKVSVKDVSDSMQVWAVFDNDTSHEDHASPEFYLDVESEPLRTIHTHLKFDPRLTGLGLRGVLPSDQPKVMSFCGAGDSLVQLAPSVESVDLVNNKDYILHRCLWGVAEGVEELGNGKGVVAEHNLDVLNGVSYHKGCYIGQELTARTHYQGVVRKKICIVRAAGGKYAELKPGDSLTLGDSRGGGKGEIRAWEPEEGIGLAMIRVDAMAEDLVTEDGTLVKAVQPKWAAEPEQQVKAD